MANTRGKGLSLEASTAGLTRPERRAYAYSTLRPPTFSGDSLASAVWLTVRPNPLGRRNGRDDALRFRASRVEETAEVLKVSPDTVMRDWRLARAWLLVELGS
jgi:hypothetical protein